MASHEPLGALLSYSAAILAFLIAAGVTLKDHRSLANRLFIAGMILLSLGEYCRGRSFDAFTPQEIEFWQQARIAFAAILPGVWLAFSLVFARAGSRDELSRWRWGIAGVFAANVFPLFFLTDSFFRDLPGLVPPFDRIIPLGMPGKAFYLSVLIASVLILFNLERTLRASTGRIRWQVKFIILGLAAICVAWIYNASQALLYSSLDLTQGILQSSAILISCLLFIWGLKRSQFLNVDVYFSRTTIQYSLTALLAGVYLLVVGMMGHFVRLVSPDRPLPIDSLLVMLALVGLAILLFSDRLQERIRRFVIRNFKRPLYDYRSAWMDLTSRTTSLVDVNELCTEAAKIISTTLDFLSVNIWLCEEGETRLALAGSTVFTRAQAAELLRSGKMVEAVIHALELPVTRVDLEEKPLEWAQDIMQAKPEFFEEFAMRFVLPIRTGQSMVGVLTLNGDRVGKAPLSLEDQDLLNAYTAQLAAQVLQLRLSEQMRRAKELEAFQKVSTFFVHDLKNLASRLSLTMQNLPVHFDNPEFRQDVLRVIGQSVSQIDDMCGRLSALRQNPELKLVTVDINQLVNISISDFAHATKVPVEKELGAVPKTRADLEQLHKVLTNLLLNAQEAMTGEGKIRISTGASNGQVTISVADNGCGMSKQFIHESLFQPFRSTKKRGMGIGLYQCKMIVEAHRGRIEVESEEGKGSVFKVILPLIESAQ